MTIKETARWIQSWDPNRSSVGLILWLEEEEGGGGGDDDDDYYFFSFISSYHTDLQLISYFVINVIFFLSNMLHLLMYKIVRDGGAWQLNVTI